MAKNSLSPRINRILTGAFGPVLLGCFPLCFLMLGRPAAIVIMPFIVMAGYMWMGIQSIVYSIIMEFWVLPRIKRKAFVILVSILLCFMFPLPLFFFSYF